MQWARTNLEVISTVRNSTVNGIQCWEYLSHLTIFPLGSDSLLCCCLLWKEGFHRSSCIDHAWIQVWFPMQPKEMPFHLTNQFQPDGRWFLQNTQYFLALLSALLQTETYRSLGALPAAHTRCCPLYFVSCFAFPWDISGESVAHRAVLDSRVLAVALPEVPAAVCRGCFLHTAEASSSPSDPLGLKAAKQIVTHDIHPAAYRNCSQLQKKKQKKISPGWCKAAKAICLFVGAATHSSVLKYSMVFNALSNNRHFTKNKPNEKQSFYVDISPTARGEERRWEGPLRKMNYQCKWLFPTVGSSLIPRYFTTR